MVPETRNTSITPVETLVEKARVAELRRDADGLNEILSNFWTDGNLLTPLTDFPAEVHAELLRLYGFYLTFYGRSKNLKDYQEKAKNALTRAHELFIKQGNEAKAAESNVLLAFCYWNAGDVKNCEALLELCEFDFPESISHPVVLHIKINRLLLLCWMQRLEESFAIYKEITPVVKTCDDILIKILYYCESAILLQRRKDYHSSIFHFTEATRLCRENENYHLLALNLNNHSLLYLEWGMPREAHHFSNESLKLLVDMKQTGWIPHILDSQALIYLYEGKNERALEVVETALEYFSRGEDYQGLTASLWTRVQCLIRLRRIREANFAYGELHRTAMEKIGTDAAEKFAIEFEREIYPLQGKSFEDEILGLENMLITNAMRKTGGAVGKAAELLQIDKHQTLSRIIATRHPDIKQNLGLKPRARRNSKTNKRTKNKNLLKSPAVVESLPLIEPVDLEGRRVAFTFDFDGVINEVFYFPESVMSVFGINDDALVATRIVKHFKPDMSVLSSQDETFYLSKIQYDVLLRVFFLLDEDGVPATMPEKLAGEPFAYCLFDDIENNQIIFNKLSK